MDTIKPFTPKIRACSKKDRGDLLALKKEQDGNVEVNLVPGQFISV